MITLPTLITLSRLAFLPVLLWLLLAGYIWAAFALYVLGAISDFADGWIARRFSMVSEFGTFLDPIADKIYVAALFCALIGVGFIAPIGLIAIIIILAREFMVSGLREYLGPKNIQLPVSKLAKWKTAFQMIATGVLILTPMFSVASLIGHITLIAAAILTLITGWQYLKTGLAHMDKTG